MIRTAVAPDGTSWTIRVIDAPWTLRYRATFEWDPIGVVLWLGAWLLLAVEAVVWMLAWGIRRLRHTLGTPWTVEARTPGPPDRMLAWSFVGLASSRAKVTEIAAGIAQGKDVAATAARRVVGGETLRP